MHEYLAIVKTLTPVLKEGRSLDASWDQASSPLAKEITYGVLRDYYRLSAIVTTLVKKPLTDKNLDVKILILAGIYSVDHIRRPDYTSVNEVVSTATDIAKPWAKGIINGVLRNYLRARDEIVSGLVSDEALTNHPAWLAATIRSAWPQQADDIMLANNAHAPMTLRVNLSRGTRDEYLLALKDAGMAGRAGELSAAAIYLDEPASTEKLPGFKDGLVSVQDEASQLAIYVLAPLANEKILDACAAPGGKTGHILESAPGVALTALDIDPDRLQQIRQNLKRIDLPCDVIAGDLRKWQPGGGKFDRILLDAPCSATGIIRRHPDIKLLRRQSDIAKLVSAQTELLRAAFELLKEGGVLVYSTCSILPAENEGVISQFVAVTSAAQPEPIDFTWGLSTGIGRQLLPTTDRHDGFYYARLVKHSQKAQLESTAKKHSE
ncbi:MAG: 16S rRNA (cytosine(967)-C(5))-methyltransferase RsmB [Pseudomonadales bacterium]